MVWHKQYFTIFVEIWDISLFNSKGFPLYVHTQHTQREERHHPHIDTRPPSVYYLVDRVQIFYIHYRTTH